MFRSRGERKRMVGITLKSSETIEGVGETLRRATSTDDRLDHDCEVQVSRCLPGLSGSVGGNLKASKTDCLGYDEVGA